RGGAGFTAFASAKAAQRSLAQSMGRHLSPDDVAESAHFLAHQPRSAWTFDLDLRPYTETW
ncbi:MAG: short-chain dehydrogenase, partial [Thiohalorhabdaceae bacterium]